MMYVLPLYFHITTIQNTLNVDQQIKVSMQMQLFLNIYFIEF